MNKNWKYILILSVYIIAVIIGVELFGLGGGVVAGIVGPVIGVLLTWADSGDKRKPTTNSSDDTSVTPDRGILVETHSERKEHAKSRLSDKIILRENQSGEIDLQIKTDGIRNIDRMAMLYVFGQWAKADQDTQSTPVITKQEIRENTGLKGGAVRVFLGKMKYFIVRYYPEDYSKRREMDDEEMEFELNEDHLEEIVDYISGNIPAPD